VGWHQNPAVEPFEIPADKQRSGDDIELALLHGVFTHRRFDPGPELCVAFAIPGNHVRQYEALRPGFGGRHISRRSKLSGNISR